jgi:hypothetical protein
MNQNLPDSRVRNKKVRYEHLSFLNSVLLNGAKTRACHLSLSKVCCIHFCVRSRLNPRNFFEHVNATQCVTASADFPSSINLHESKCIMTSVWIRSPPSPHSCENWDYLVLQSYDASCDETYWCYHFCFYGNPAQRYARHGCPCTVSMESEMECPLGTDKRIRAQGKILIILRKK